MLNFLHSFQPEPILFALGPVKIHWYGLALILGMLAAMFVFFRLVKKYKLDSEKMIDMVFWTIILGIIGARLYDVLLEFPYYLNKPLDIFKIWQGGLAIHGAIIAGAIVIWFFAKKQKISFWLIASLVVPALALAQAIGRWGNYFNQELFGRPTGLAWGIPIDVFHRPADYLSDVYFHPVFLYESIGNLFVFTILLILHKKTNILEKVYWQKIIVLIYLMAYSLLRFSMEFIRIDSTPTIAGLRWPQIISVLIFSTSLVYFLLILKTSNAKQTRGLGSELSHSAKASRDKSAL
jgi:phosphatidylglycerol:prolipoprotein diacylglycerol transferase